MGDKKIAYDNTEARGGFKASTAAKADGQIRSMDRKEHLTNPSGGKEINAGEARFKVPELGPHQKGREPGNDKLKTPLG